LGCGTSEERAPVGVGVATAGGGLFTVVGIGDAAGAGTATVARSERGGAVSLTPDARDWPKAGSAYSPTTSSSTGATIDRRSSLIGRLRIGDGSNELDDMGTRRTRPAAGMTQREAYE